MKLIAWNCRGLARASTIRSLRAKVRKHSPDILYLFETKIPPSAACIILNGLEFFSMVHAPPYGSKGGLVLAWKLGVDLECFQINVNIISVWCYSDPPNNPWMLSCIYGSPYTSGKPEFWDNMMQLGTNWVLIVCHPLPFQSCLMAPLSGNSRHLGVCVRVTHFRLSSLFWELKFCLDYFINGNLLGYSKVFVLLKLVHQ
jgi:hypothetical protein